MNDKMLNAIKEITEEILEMDDEKLNKIIESHKDGLYASIIYELYFRGKNG